MMESAIICIGILLLIFVKLSYRSTKIYLEQKGRSHSIYVILWTNIGFALLAALGVFLILMAISCSDWYNHLKSGYLAVPSSSGVAAVQDDPGSQTMGLIFAALGIVMTLVTTIVISVSRSAVEDIRAIEERFLAKKDEINGGINELHRAREASEARLMLVLKAIHANRDNMKALKAIRSNKPHPDPDQSMEYDFRLQLEEMYFIDENDSDAIRLFTNLIEQNMNDENRRAIFFHAMGDQGRDYIMALIHAQNHRYQTEPSGADRKQLSRDLDILKRCCDRYQEYKVIERHLMNN